MCVDEWQCVRVCVRVCDVRFARAVEGRGGQILNKAGDKQAYNQGGVRLEWRKEMSLCAGGCVVVWLCCIPL